MQLVTYPLCTTTAPSTASLRRRNGLNREVLEQSDAIRFGVSQGGRDGGRRWLEPSQALGRGLWSGRVACGLGQNARAMQGAAEGFPEAPRRAGFSVFQAGFSKARHLKR